MWVPEEDDDQEELEDTIYQAYHLKVPSSDSIYDRQRNRKTSFRSSGSRFRSSSPLPTVSRQSSSPRLETYDHPTSSSGSSIVNHGLVSGSGDGEPLIRKLSIKRPVHNPEALGFAILGGRTRGRGIYVSRVDDGSPADVAGLCPGDQILVANHLSFLDFTLKEALEILHSSKTLHLTVMPPSNETKNKLPIRNKFSWVDKDGRPTSPPAQARSLAATAMDISHGSLRHKSKSSRDPGAVKIVSLEVGSGQSLGLMIRGGWEYRLGIYISGVDHLSAADIVGMQVGDQILAVNEHDFRKISHQEAADVLKYSPCMTMTVRNVGKVPHSFREPSIYNDSIKGGGGNQQIPSSRLSRRGSSRKLLDDEVEVNPGCSLSMPSTSETAELRLDKKAEQLLTENERLTLAYYCNEYETNAMTVDAFVAVLLEFLETPEKYNLMTEIRGLVRKEDIDKFDELIYRREMQAMRSKEVIKLAEESDNDSMAGPSSGMERSRSPRGSFRRNMRRIATDPHLLTVPESKAHVHDVEEHTASEDSGVDLANGTYLGSQRGSRVSIASMRENGNESGVCPISWKPVRFSGRRSIDVHRESNAATLLRRTMLRRHSSGGEGVNPEERKSAVVRVSEDRRWSIGSEVPDPPIMLENDAPQPKTRILVVQPSEEVPVSAQNSPSPTWLEVPHLKVRRHRSLPDPHAFKPKRSTHRQESPLQHRSASMRLPGHRTIAEGNNLRVTIKKSRPILGIAIEGGADTSQPLPRIISIHSSGAAFEAGGLKVGHLILEIDGIRMSRRKHDDAAKLIAEAFYNSERDYVEFLVTEKAKTLMDLRRSSVLLFD